MGRAMTEREIEAVLMESNVNGCFLWIDDPLQTSIPSWD